jgi:hypothetical protein
MKLPKEAEYMEIPDELLRSLRGAYGKCSIIQRLSIAPHRRN